LVCPLFANPHKSKVAADQAADDQDKKKNESGGAKRSVTFTGLLPGRALLDQFQFEEAR